MADDPADHLAELFEAVMQGRRPHPLAARWFTAGVLRSMRGSESLDAALGLSGSGVRSLRRRVMLARRNRHLRAAVQAVGLEQDVVDWDRCKRLAPLVVSFMRAWPRLQQLPCAGEDWPSWKTHVWHAASCGLEVPMTAKGLLYAVKRSTAYSLDEGGANMLARFI